MGAVAAAGSVAGRRPASRQLLCVALALLLAAPAVSAAASAAVEDEDIVILANRHRLHGSVVDDGSGDSITVRTGNGVLVLPRTMVVGIEAGFRTRRAALQPGDYRAHLDLARWCMVRQRKGDALALLEPFLKDPRLDQEGLRLLATLIDELRNPDDALPLYQRYREMGGSDPAVLRRLAQLEDAIAAYERQQQQLAQGPSTSSAKEGLEVQARWSPEDVQWANPVAATMVAAGQSGDQVLQLAYQAGAADKKATVRWRQKLDVRRSNLLVMQVNNPGKEPLRLSVAVKSGPNWTYYESRTHTVPADTSWHRVEFDLLATDFKAESTGWKHGTGITTPEDIRELQMQIHNGSRAGRIFVNNLGFLSSPQPSASGDDGDAPPPPAP